MVRAVTPIVSLLAVVVLCAKAPAAEQPVAPATQAALEVSRDTRWQPLDGEVAFTLGGLAVAPDKIAVCFRWHKPDADQATSECVPSTSVRRLPRATKDNDTDFRFAARVPNLDGGASGVPWIAGWRHAGWTGAVPVADMVVHASGGSGQAAYSVEGCGPVGISTVWIALLAAAASVGAFSAFLVYCASRRNIPGGRLLRVVASPNGVASLSQFQILLWTIVIGAGAVYVMVLTGNLIDVPTPTLGLLGVSGFALIGSQIVGNADGSPKRIDPPGPVQNLAVSGAPLNDAVTLIWAAPQGETGPFACTLRLRENGTTNWQVWRHDIQSAPVTVSGLTPGGCYDFEICAVNAGGVGQSALLLGVKLDPGAAAAGVSRPAPLTGLAAKPVSETAITLSWALPASHPDAVKVQYRPAGTLLWFSGRSVGGSATQETVGDLDSGTEYEFQAVAVTAWVPGLPAETVTAATLPRLPKWADLVVIEGENGVEIDLSRVQMLIFTSIAAAFTSLTLLQTGQIPDIPPGELALIGLSNGVYLASKAARKGAASR